MRFPVGVFVGIVATGVSESEPVKSLQRLNGFSAEIFQSGAFDHKSVNWRNKWIQKFQTNADRMERNVGRKCGFVDLNMHTFDYEYDTENACNGIKMIIDGYSRWSENHLNLCYGQRNNNYQQNRMKKWSGILTNVLDCEEKVDSYTFVLPEDWLMQVENGIVAKGESFQFSNSCNPDWEDVDGDDCERWLV